MTSTPSFSSNSLKLIHAIIPSLYAPSEGFPEENQHAEARPPTDLFYLYLCAELN